MDYDIALGLAMTW